MSVTANLNGYLGLTDNLTNSTTFEKQLQLSFSGVVSSYAQSLLIGTGGTSISIPNSAAQFLYVKNLSTVSSTNSSVAVQWTPESGTQATIITLIPGAAIIFCEPTTGAGISSLVLTASVASTPVEFTLLG
jgi:hypothetical protein